MKVCEDVCMGIFGISSAKEKPPLKVIPELYWPIILNLLPSFYETPADSYEIIKDADNIYITLQKQHPELFSSHSKL